MIKNAILLTGTLLLSGLLCAAPEMKQNSLTEETYLQMAEKAIKSLQGEYPELYKYSHRLLEIRQEIDTIINSYRDGVINKSEAMERIEPLVKEELQIRNNPDYQVKVRVIRILTEPAFPQP